MMFKKGQIPSQVFMYVFALLVISLVLLFGITAINDFIDRTDRIELVKFKSDIKSEIQTISTEYGSVINPSLTLSKRFKRVCFADDRAINNLGSISNPLIRNSIENQVKDNVFLVEEIGVEQLKTMKIEVLNDKGFLCIENTQGKISFHIRGKGRYVEIYE